jgi:hypothetical protein
VGGMALGDGEEPGRKARPSGVEVGERPKGGEERLLGQVLTGRSVEAEQPEETEQGTLVAQDQQAKRLPVAVPDLLDQSFVFHRRPPGYTGALGKGSPKWIGREPILGRPVQVGMKRPTMVPHAAVAAAFILAAPSCASVDRLVMVFRSTDAFIASPDDPRVLYEPGAEALARPVVAALPDAIAEVEAATYGPFVVPIRIYVCGTLDCYRRFTGNDRSRGQTNPRGKIFISPKPENSAARVPFVVAHELTHLHLVQRCSIYRAAQMPSWFNEGFAALVSKGGGAEGVSDADAARAILAGRTFTPTTEHGFSGSHFGLPAHMFYRQAALFIAYLRARDGGAFRAFILDLEAGTPFGQAFGARFHSQLIPIWRDFVAQQAGV